MAGLSLALHAPLILQERLGEVWEEKENIVYVAKESAKSVLNSHPLEKRRYIDELKEALERGEHIDLGEFYLKSQYLDGRLEADRMREALDKLASVEAEVRIDKDKMGTLDVLDGIKERDGKHEAAHSYLSTVVLEGKGNCKARERFSASLVDRVYPDMEIAYQKVKLDGGRHTRTLVKAEGQWRNMEDPTGPPLSESDLAGTVLFSKYDYVQHYVGQDNLGEYKKPSRVIESHTKFLITDDYLVPPLPGVDFDHIKDVSSSGSGASGMALGSVGKVAFGSPAPVDENGQSSMGVNGFASDPIELEILTAADIEKNRSRTRGILGYWEYLNTNSFMIEEELRLILPKMNDSCFDVVAPVVKAGGKSVLQNCKMHESSGLLSCEGGLDGLVPDEVKRKNFADLACLPANLDRCRPVDYKSMKYFLHIASYLEMVFALSALWRYTHNNEVLESWAEDLDHINELRSLGLQLGILKDWSYATLSAVLTEYKNARFVGISYQNGDQWADFRTPGGEERSTEIGQVFDNFYCYDPSAPLYDQ